MIYRRLLKQNKLLGLWPGALLTQFGNSLMYLTVFNTLMIAVTAWYTTLSTFLPFPFWVFVGVIVVAELVVMVLDYKFIQPSRVAYTNLQGWQHQNLSREQFKGVRTEIQELKDELSKLTKLVEKLQK